MRTIIICDEDMCKFKDEENLCMRGHILMEKNPNGAYNPSCKSMVSEDDV